MVTDFWQQGAKESGGFTTTAQLVTNMRSYKAI